VNARRSTPDQKGGSAETPAEHPWLRRGFEDPTSTLLGAAAGIDALVLGTAVGRLVFDNAYGLSGEFGPLGTQLPTAIGTSATYASGVALGLAAFASTRWLGGRSRVALLMVVAVAATAGWVLYPRRMEVSQFNEHVACTGGCARVRLHGAQVRRER
jgi:hypothetical protein